jgi:aminoglycoside 3-N-acetyltransferase I
MNISKLLCNNPMTIDIKKLGSQDIDAFVQLIQLFKRVFEMQHFTMLEQSYLQQLLEKEGFFVFVALFDRKVVGGLTAYTLQQYYSTKPLMYIYDLAVETNVQRQGIGTKLIAHLTQYCKDIGVEEVFVQADEMDDHALEFYRSTGGTAEKVVHFGYPFISSTANTVSSNSPENV